MNLGVIADLLKSPSSRLKFLQKFLRFRWEVLELFVQQRHGLNGQISIISLRQNQISNLVTNRLVKELHKGTAVFEANDEDRPTFCTPDAGQKRTEEGDGPVPTAELDAGRFRFPGRATRDLLGQLNQSHKSSPEVDGISCFVASSETLRFRRVCSIFIRTGGKYLWQGRQGHQTHSIQHICSID